MSKKKKNDNKNISNPSKPYVSKKAEKRKQLMRILIIFLAISMVLPMVANVVFLLTR